MTISPRLNSACTSAAGLASIFSAKSDSDAPRASRMVSPLPCGNRTPPTTGACMFSYSARFCPLRLAAALAARRRDDRTRLRHRRADRDGHRRHRRHRDDRGSRRPPGHRRRRHRRRRHRRRCGSYRRRHHRDHRGDRRRPPPGPRPPGPGRGPPGRPPASRARPPRGRGGMLPGDSAGSRAAAGPRAHRDRAGACGRGNRPLDRLRRGERVVADARGARGAAWAHRAPGLDAGRGRRAWGRARAGRGRRCAGARRCRRGGRGQLCCRCRGRRGAARRLGAGALSRARPSSRPRRLLAGAPLPRP